MISHGLNRRVRSRLPSCSRHMAREGSQAADRDPAGRSAYVELYPRCRRRRPDHRNPDHHGGASARIPGEARSRLSSAADHSGGGLRASARAAMPSGSGVDRLGAEGPGNPVQPAAVLVRHPVRRRGPRHAGGRAGSEGHEEQHEGRGGHHGTDEAAEGGDEGRAVRNGDVGAARGVGHGRTSSPAALKPTVASDCLRMNGPAVRGHTNSANAAYHQSQRLIFFAMRSCRSSPRKSMATTPSPHSSKASRASL